MADYNLDSGDLGGGGGLGLEMLMNRNVKENSHKFFSGNNLDDVTNLDQALNDNMGVGNDYHHQSSLFSDGGGAGEGETPLGDIPLYESQRINFNETPTYDDAGTKTWDDYGKYDNIPSDGGGMGGGSGAPSEEAIIAEKMDILRKLETLELKGTKLLKKYTITDSIGEMRAELKALTEETKRRANISFYKQSLLYCMHGLEWMNTAIQPIDGFTLDGFTAELEAAVNSDAYEEVLAELYEKYKTQLTVWPELKLLFLLGGGIGMFNMRKQMVRQASNMVSQMMNQYPDASQMADQAMMQSMLGGGSGMPFGGGQGQAAQQPYAPQYNPRFAPPLPAQGQRPPDPPMRTRDLEPTPMAATAGARYSGPPPQANVAPSAMRPEMRGPQELNSFFSGINARTRVVDIPVVNRQGGGDDADTVITLDEVKGGGGALPRRSGTSGRRSRGTSEKNNMSL